MKALLYYSKLVACCLLFFLSINQTKAANVMGTYVGYEAIDSTTYKVIVILYADCGGIPITSATIKIKGKSTGTFTATLPLISTRDVTASFLGCPAQSRCTGSFAYGFEERIFIDTVDISGGDCTYTFSYENCCRSSAITTGAAGTSAYNYASVYKCAGLNTSPRPMSDPQFLLPQGSDIAISPTMMEFNDKVDSVVFSLVEPLDNTGNPTTYSGNFTAQDPFTYLGFPNNSLAAPAGFHFDPVTGTLAFRPTKKNEIGIYVVEAQEYRKVNGTDILVGVSRLELTNIIVSVPNNKLPSAQATGITQNICAGTKTCFSYTTTDADINDSTFLQFSNTLPGALFYDTRSSNNGSGDFCWTPTANDVRRAPYLLTTTVRDNACPTNGITSKTLAVYVNPTYNTTNHAVVTKIVSCNRAIITAQKDSFPDLTLDWKTDDGLIDTIIGDSAVMYFANTGWNHFGIRSKNGAGCYGPYEWDSVFINPLNTLLLSKTSDTVSCKLDTFQLAVTPLNGSIPYKYRWEDAPTANAPIIHIQSNETKYHKVIVTDGAGCLTKDSIRVAVSAPDAEIGHDTTVCKYLPFTLTATNPVGIAPFSYEWVGIDSLQTVTTSVTDSTTFHLKITDSTGCYNLLTKKVTPFKFSLSAGPDQTACYGANTTVLAQAFDGAGPFSFPWPNVLPNKASYTYTSIADSTFTISVTDSRGCVAYDTIIIKTNPPIMITLPSSVDACIDNDVILTATVSGGTNPYLYNWNGSTGISNVHQFKVTSTTTLMQLTVTDSLNCSNSKNVNITILPQPTVTASSNQTVCYGTTVSLSATASAGSAPYNFAWDTGDSTDSTSITAYASATYKVTVTDNNGCTNNHDVVVTVMPRANVTITSPFQVCANYSGTIALSASIPGGTWSGAGVSGSTFDPSTVTIGKHQLYYSFIGSNLCPEQDTTEAEILPNASASFFASSVSGGLSSTIQFFDASLGGPTSWQWSVSDNSGAVVFTSMLQNPSFTFSSLGKYSVKLIVGNGACYDTLVKTDYIDIISVGIADVETTNYKIYPNPATTQITVEGANIKQITITDMQGRLILASVLNTGNSYSVNIADVAAGVYIVNVEENNHAIYHKKVTISK